MLLEIDDKTATLIRTALDIGAYPDEQALLDAGLDDARAKVALWAEEMERRAKGPWIDGETVFQELKDELNDRAKAKGEL